MEKSSTGRGFTIIFQDENGIECTIQESSSMGECKIWLGAKDIGLKHFKAYKGWEDVKLENTIEEYYIANNRMHLTQEQVAEMLPILEKFVKTGEI